MNKLFSLLCGLALCVCLAGCGDSTCCKDCHCQQDGKCCCSGACKDNCDCKNCDCKKPQE